MPMFGWPGAAVAAPASGAPLPTLSVAVIGPGTVSSQPAGISCPGKCTAPFPAGARVVLTAKPGPGSTFVRWSGSCSTKAICTVTVSELVAVAAQFSTTPSLSGPGPRYIAAPGPYTGSNGQNGNGFSLYVERGGRSMVNVVDPLTSLSCQPSGGISDHFNILQVPLGPGGSFSIKTTEQGVINNAAAKFTFTLAGHFEAASGTASAMMAGTWREDVMFASGTTTSCTTNTQSFSTTLNREAASAGLVMKGNYTGNNGQNGNGLSFSVVPGGRGIINVSDPLTQLACLPSSAVTDHLQVLQVQVSASGSFTSTTSEQGTIAGQAAKVKFLFEGFFEGPASSSGATTAAGIWREDVTFSSGSTTSCTSNDIPWTASVS